jgi:hypothetical protein
MDPVSCVNPIYQGYLYNNGWAITDFWTRANTLDAAIHFVNAAYSKWPAQAQQWCDDMASRLGTGTQTTTEDQFFQPMLDNVGVWDDDFGWCGLASPSAYDFLRAYDLSGGRAHAAVYLDIAQTCWLRLVGTGYDLAAEPMPVPHGCRNSSVSASSNAMGVKNTVTGAGFFLLSLRPYNTLKSVTPRRRASCSRRTTSVGGAPAALPGLPRGQGRTVRGGCQLRRQSQQDGERGVCVPRVESRLPGGRDLRCPGLGLPSNFQELLAIRGQAPRLDVRPRPGRPCRHDRAGGRPGCHRGGDPAPMTQAVTPFVSAR